MATIFATVQNYQLSVSARSVNTRYVIYVYGTMKTTLKRVILTAVFMKPGVALAPNSRTTLADGGLNMIVQLPDSEVARWVDVLRNEKPLELMILDDNGVDLGTGLEAAGAHEIGA